MAKGKIKRRRTKKFWSGVFLTSIGSFALLISWVGNHIFVVDSWLWTVTQEITGFGLGTFILGIGLIIWGRNLRDITG